MGELMQTVGVSASSPVLMRIFKEESKFEVWKMDASGRYKLLKTYDICKWSGKLGPKIKEGDRQAPEGYYAITPGLMNPNSAYYLSFNTGFPNTFDRANGRTGTALMVHGSCSSRGCYAMTDAQIGEIYALARDAFKGGQKAFQLQAYPFRMTAENMARHWDDPSRPFWQMLKEGYDSFELTRQEPKVDVCGRKYVFNATPKGAMNPVDACPELVKPADLQVALAAKARADEEKAIVLAAKFRAERQAEERRQILIAQNVEEERKRAEAARLVAEQRGKGDDGRLIASLAGGIAGVVSSALPGGAPEPTVVASAEPAEEPTPPGAAPASGTPSAATGPLPKPDPRTPPVALAMTEAPPPAASEGVGSMFGRLFSFGSGEARPAAAAAVTPAEAAPVVAASAPASAPSPAASARAAPATVARLAPNVSDPTMVASIAPAQPAAVVRGLSPAAAACTPPTVGGAPSGASPACPPETTTEPPPVAAAPPAPNGLIERIGNWF